MQNHLETDTTVYKVIISQEDQYSIWPAYKEEPQGWTTTGKQGSQEECLAHIQEVWSDMRPKTLRDKMTQH